MTSKIQKITVWILAAVLAFIIVLRAAGSEFVAKVIFTFIIYAATFAAAYNCRREW